MMGTVIYWESNRLLKSSGYSKGSMVLFIFQLQKCETLNVSKKKRFRSSKDQEKKPTGGLDVLEGQIICNRGSILNEMEDKVEDDN